MGKEGQVMAFRGDAWKWERSGSCLKRKRGKGLFLSMGNDALSCVEGRICSASHSITACLIHLGFGDLCA